MSDTELKKRGRDEEDPQEANKRYVLRFESEGPCTLALFDLLKGLPFSRMSEHWGDPVCLFLLWELRSPHRTVNSPNGGEFFPSFQDLTIVRKALEDKTGNQPTFTNPTNGDGIADLLGDLPGNTDKGLQVDPKIPYYFSTEGINNQERRTRSNLEPQRNEESTNNAPPAEEDDLVDPLADLELASLFFAPMSNSTTVNKQNLVSWSKKQKVLDFPWAMAATVDGKWMRITLIDPRQFDRLRSVRLSEEWIWLNRTDTWMEAIRAPEPALLAPIAVSPVHKDISVPNLIKIFGTTISHIRKIGPSTYAANVWSVEARHRLLTMVDNTSISFSPASIEAGKIDLTACHLYNNGSTQLTTPQICQIVSNIRCNLVEAVAQYVDPINESPEQIWFLGCDNPKNAHAFFEKGKQYLARVNAKFGYNLNLGPCKAIVKWANTPVTSASNVNKHSKSQRKGGNQKREKGGGNSRK